MTLSVLGIAFRAGISLSLGLCVNAVPSVNVALRTPFAAPPYLLELLETAADENVTSYFPLLDRIAEGYFDTASTDEELYTRFRALLQNDGHLKDPQQLSSFDLALSIHSTTPRIEAHNQFYNTSILPLISEKEQGCESWVHATFLGQRFCSSELDPSHAQPFGKVGESPHQLAFDRVLGDKSHKYASVLYADITSASFRYFHKTLSKTAKEGKSSYRLRYKPGGSHPEKLVDVSGYGVELALKRTDYIVIDDRQDEETQKQDSVKADAVLNEDEVSDLRPLSASEVARLGLKAASFVLDSEDPLDILARLSQDFPKFSSAVAAMNVSSDFLAEHRWNRDIILPAGVNILWINGVQIMARDVNVYSLLEHLRRERKMIDGVREIGLTGQEAISLLSHEAITALAANPEINRYYWRDEEEGGNVIMWLNDIEKDKRYAHWPISINGLLQRTFPGQLPSIRRDLHNLVVPVDFSSYADVVMVIENLQTFVKRSVPIRFGLVPYHTTSNGEQQAKLVYYLLDTYGLAATLKYLEDSIEGAGRKFGPPQEQYLSKAVTNRKVRRDRTPLSLPEILSNVALGQRLLATRQYTDRLAITDTSPTIFVNGVPITPSDQWLQVMSQQVGLDMRIAQDAVYQGIVTEDSYLPELFLSGASKRRVPIIVPETDKDTKHLYLGDHIAILDLPSVPSQTDTIERELIHMVIIADMDSFHGLEQVMEALLFQRAHGNVEVAWLGVEDYSNPNITGHQMLGKQYMLDLLTKFDALADSELQSENSNQPLDLSQRKSIYEQLFSTRSADSKVEIKEDSLVPQARIREILAAVEFHDDQKVIVFNGRIVGPIPSNMILSSEDLDSLLEYERKQRLLPAAKAIQELQLDDKASTPFSFAKISNLIALSQVSEVPEGIFDAAPTVRTSVFKKWNSTHSAIKIGDEAVANIQIVASIDPASEVAQRWIPIITALSELSGVCTHIFINPKERLGELPIKRFYRHVLESKPIFDQDGSLRTLSAKFAGMPAEALLNMGMDLPPSWLVAPKESIHDLDNIKLSAVASGSDIEATYELEHILIEGHSTDVTTGQPPRGAQLSLGTKHDPQSADTIIMANLGYFQFKANPGVYNLALQEGRSQEIYHIDSAGVLTQTQQAAENGTEIALTSFRGSTLFPRLSRKPGMEEEDVLETHKTPLESFADGADKLLAQAGLPGTEAGKYLSKAAKLGGSIFSNSGKAVIEAEEKHAEINIFSVASGHLYERMLNIMMLSVMKNTNHSVKFWFIEQFLSPSFKDFLPALAKEYGFKYEMVTYKWPHWLRSQKEKQREIWGYKILFLDVLFPLSLDKVIFVDADQIVRTDMYELVQHDLHGAPYGFTPMCDSRTEMEGFRFWKQGYWKNFLQGLPYHISALYVVDLKKFRQIAAGDRLRQQYHQLSADPASLSNLDQDLPNHMQTILPIHSLPQDWLWCETWCSDEALKTAKTIDLCNNPQTKEPKLDRARRQVPEWTIYDDEIAAVAKKYRDQTIEGTPIAGAADSGPEAVEEESVQERLQREDAERERRLNQPKEHARDEL